MLYQHPHAATIVKVVPFKEQGEGTGVAAVQLGYGPIVIRAKLNRPKDGGPLYLQMPAKQNKEEKWYDQAFFTDTSLKKHYETLAIEALAAYERSAAAA